MKDYFDLRALAANFNYNGATLERAVRNTFARRQTRMPDGIPTGLSDDFAIDPAKVAQWTAFLRRIGRENEGTLAACLAEVRTFAIPVLQAAMGSAAERDLGAWTPQVGWTAPG